MLTYLRSYSPASMGELHRVFGVPRSTLTGIVDRLTRQGLVTRQESERDRRSLRIHISRNGIEVAAALQQHVDHLESTVREIIDDRDLAGFNAVMDAIGRATGIVVREESESKEETA